MTSIKQHLRPKRKVNYQEAIQKFDETESSDSEFKLTVESDGSNDSNSGSELFSKNKKRKEPVFVEKDIVQLLAEDENNEYRQQRLKNMKNRLMLLKSMDSNEDIKEFKSLDMKRSCTVKKSVTPKRKQYTESVVLPRKRSLRLMNRSIDQSNQINDTNNSNLNNFQEENNATEEQRIEGELNFSEMEEKIFLGKLKDVLSTPSSSTDDFASFDFERLTTTIKSCYMLEDPVKIIHNRITSLDLHSSEQKFLALAGDKSGNIALWNLMENTGVKMKSHLCSVNCVTFSLQNNTKFFTTSLDGTVRQGDINKNSNILIYASYDKIDHTTWHYELGHSLLIAEGGTGSVKMVDTRTPNSNYITFKCHNRSVRTVQSHPINDNYFLTSSGDGFFGVWDVRYATKNSQPIILQSFSKGLTSAFYSGQGKYVLTTGNDDTICVYQCSDNVSQKITQIAHNNHGGRWLSVFKAKWLPNREDCFCVGSLFNNPKRMQVYNREGKILHELKSERMNTYCPVIAVHPKKLLIVGGNGSGKIHVFAPCHNLKEI
ncbi:hypothetical protein PGB90_000349 [Kerria lacca]